VPKDRHLTGQRLTQGRQLFQQKEVILRRKLLQEEFIQLREEAVIQHSDHQGAAVPVRLKAQAGQLTGQVHRNPPGLPHPHRHMAAHGVKAVSLQVLH